MKILLEKNPVVAGLSGRILCRDPVNPVPAGF